MKVKKNKDRETEMEFCTTRMVYGMKDNSNII